jgi:hypothetical protein
MKPQEVAEYRSRWMAQGTQYTVLVDEFAYYRSKKWCRDNIDAGTWVCVRYHTPYDEASFTFQYKKDQDAFIEQDGGWVL